MLIIGEGKFEEIEMHKVLERDPTGEVLRSEDDKEEFGMWSRILS